MMLSKYVDKLTSSGSKYSVCRTHAGLITISPDLAEVVENNNNMLKNKDSSGLTELVVNSYSQRFCNIDMKHIVNREEVLRRSIGAMISAVKEYNKANSSLSNPRMGGIHKFLKTISAHNIVANSGKSKIKEFVDSLTFIYMMINTSSESEEVMDMIASLKRQYEGVIRAI